VRQLLPWIGRKFRFSHRMFTHRRRISPHGLAGKRSGSPDFTVSGARQHGHPGFPLFLRPPGARS